MALDFNRLQHFFSDCTLLLYICLVPQHYNLNHIVTHLKQTVRQHQIEYRGARVINLIKAEHENIGDIEWEQGLFETMRQGMCSRPWEQDSQSRLPAWGRRQGAWREIDTNKAAYLIDCTMPAFIASLVAFRWDVVSVNVSHSIKTRTYCCALGNTWLFLERLWVEYRIISCDLCTLVGDSTSLASVDSTLKYKSNSEARPWPPGCCAFQCLMQMVLWKCIRCQWRKTVAHTSKNLKSWV